MTRRRTAPEATGGGSGAQKEAAVTGPYPELARQVRQLLGALSSRAAAAKTGISHATIVAMARGARVSMESIVKFAQGFGADPNKLLASARYPPLPAAPVDPSPAVPAAAGDDPLLGVGSDVDLALLARVPMAAGSVSADLMRVKEPVDAPPQALGEALPGQVRAIRVDGDCMEPFYRSGDVLLVRESDDAQSGDKVIALVDWSSITCKVYRQNGARYLEPSNGEGHIGADRFRILGIVVGFFRRERR